MKPFTLEWWIERLIESINRQISALGKTGRMSPVAINRYIIRYRELSQYIMKRIVNKYGEQP